MIVGDLFSGIGGFSLAAEWMGWRTAWFSEIDPFASRVLAHHWPDVPNHGDITRIDWTTVEPVDVLTGGFPCQPHSLAGKRLASSDERDLFSEIIRAVRVLRPRFIVLENVRGLLTSESGRFFGRVLGSLAECGYDAEWRVLSAADVGAPHKRERVWIVAYATSDGGDRREWAARRTRANNVGRCVGDAIGEGQPQLRGMLADERRRDCNASGSVEHTESRGRRARTEQPARRADGGCAGLGDADDTGPQGHGRPVGIIGAEGWNTEGRHCTAASSVVGWRDAIYFRGADNTVRAIPEDAARGIESPLYPVAHGVPARVAQLRGVGNSIVPQCALEIFRTIDAMMRQERAA